MIDVELSKNSKYLYVSYYDNNGQLRVAKQPILDNMRFSWTESDNNDVQHKLQNQYGRGVYKKRGRINKFRMNEILNELPDKHKDILHTNNEPIIWFADIENEVIAGSFADASNPVGKIQTNAFCPSNKPVVYMQGLIKLSPEQIDRIEKRVNDHLDGICEPHKLKHLFYHSEKELLKHWCNKLVPAMPAITGWNYTEYDWQYMMSRCRQLGVDPKNTSPTRSMSIMTIKNKYDHTKVVSVPVPKHRLIFDYMTIFNKWDTYMKFKTSSGLGYVSEQVLGVSKVPYSGTLVELYENDYELFCFYNIVDSILVKLLHRKLRVFNTMLSISYRSQTPLYTALYASQVLMPMFQNEYNKRGIKITYSDRAIDGRKYSGGYVMEPNKGLKKKIAIYDYESLFPTAIMALNIGVDTYAGEIITASNINEFGLSSADLAMVNNALANGQVPWYKFDDKNVLPDMDDNHCYSAIGAVFSKDRPSVTSDVIWNLFLGRIEAKKMANSIDSEVFKLEKMLNDYD